MAFTKKISSVLNNLQSNIPSGFGSMLPGGLSNLASKVASTAQTNKVAAKLLNKSPLELDNTSVLTHMNENPFHYGSVSYPSNAGDMGEGHYMTFDILIEEATKFKYMNFDGVNIKKLEAKDPVKTGNKALDSANPTAKAVHDLKQNYKTVRKPNSGFASMKDRYTNISDTIVLYTPKTALNYNYKAEYETVDMGAMMAGITAGNMDAFLDGLAEGGKGLLIGAVDAVTGGAAGAGRQLTGGVATNPFMEQIFKTVPFRNFTHEYVFLPRNEKEKDDANKIINLFKFHMHPEMLDNARFTVPSRFQITHFYRRNVNQYLPKVARCILTDMTVNYAPEDKIQSFKPDARGAPMAHITMSLTFTETEIMTKETIAEGF